MDPLSQIRRSRVVAVLRASDASRFGDVADVLAEAGVICIEFTLSSGGALDALRKYADRVPSRVALGAGTVLDSEMAAAAVDSGATFLITPALCLDVIEWGVGRDVPVIAGALTPTEVLAAWRAGASAVKVFPVSTAGGPAYIRALRAPLADVPLVPTGGVAIADAARYLEAGAVAVGMGAPLLGDAGGGGDLGALGDRAAELVRRIAGVAP
jgi:2-dehydro-3-deoxyphosphogluconate aldolase/(4S)-4-hydroxy-2-oxoglutarate aldolase